MGETKPELDINIAKLIASFLPAPDNCQTCDVKFAVGKYLIKRPWNLDRHINSPYEPSFYRHAISKLDDGKIKGQDFIHLFEKEAKKFWNETLPGGLHQRLIKLNNTKVIDS